MTIAAANATIANDNNTKSTQISVIAPVTLNFFDILSMITMIPNNATIPSIGMIIFKAPIPIRSASIIAAVTSNNENDNFNKQSLRVLNASEYS